ncbi:TIGR01777 family oxidoreductase [Priestia abyssalis]|uniref:TIGR01777 family oxidoreductase n=1 Tax=Priestia abyssalis TaxID=1221450 RepID=UPI00099591C8|nr:TIGR01777 family oxidoreductase [Priestia abyssalis]
MKIVIAGGTGFVGKALTASFSTQQHDIWILTRRPRPSSEKIHYIEWEHASSIVQEADVVINLAGVSLNSGRWTKETKNAIVNSRISTTKQLVEMMKNTPKKVFINASAVGFYGTSKNASFTESSPSGGEDFLSNTVKAWEEEALKATQYNIRTVLTRFGIILSKNEGAFPKMLIPYQLFAGGTVGSGEQWVSWVHIEDVVRIISFIIDHEELDGPVNVTAPHPVKMKEFGQAIANVINRPHWLPVPEFALKMLLGEMSVLILKGQRVLPQKLGEHHYTFSYDKLKGALKHLT